MNRYMAARGEAMSEENSHNRAASYLRQILLPQYPKFRSQRELLTIAACLDALLDGDLAVSGRPLSPEVQSHRVFAGGGRKLAGGKTSRADPEEEKGGVPRSPKTGWSEAVKAASISYKGEVAEKAEPLEVDRVAASLPPADAGGTVDILSVCEGGVQEILSDPLKCVLPPEEMPDLIPQPRVMVQQGEWGSLAKLLYERGIVEPTDAVASVQDRLVTYGLFGVKKVGRIWLMEGQPEG